MYKKFISFFFIYTLFGFKLSITGSDSGSALSAIRVDDVLLIFFLVAYTFSGGGFSYFIRKKPVFFFLLYIFISMSSTFINSIFGEVDIVNSLLFSFRPLEYFMYIALGYEIARLNINTKKIFFVYVFYVLALIIGQTLGVIGGFSNFSFNRAIANTGGPWELAAVAGFLTIYFTEHKKIKTAALGFIILLLTQSRITLVGTILTYMIKNPVRVVKNLFGNTKTILAGVLCIVVIFSYAIYKQINYSAAEVANSDNGVAARFESFGSSDTLSELERIFYYTKAANNRQDYFNQTYGGGLSEILSNSAGGDASSFVRFTRWMVLIKTTLSNARSTLIGLGPSYADKAVDGNYVRLFVETGFLGLFSYIVFTISLFRNTKSKLMRDYIIIIAVTALFIDIFVTFKAMFLLWVCYGHYLYCKKNKIETLL